METEPQSEQEPNPNPRPGRKRRPHPLDAPPDATQRQRDQFRRPPLIVAVAHRNDLDDGW